MIFSRCPDDIKPMERKVSTLGAQRAFCDVCLTVLHFSLRPFNPSLEIVYTLYQLPNHDFLTDLQDGIVSSPCFEMHEFHWFLVYEGAPSPPNQRSAYTSPSGDVFVAVGLD